MMSGIWAVARYEFWMQLRRRALWVVLTVACGFITFRMLGLGGDKDAAPAHLLDWATILRGAAHRSLLENFLLPLAFGILLADRWPRDWRLRTAELLDATPLAVGGRLWGKLVGAGGATALPIFVYAVGVTVYFAVTSGTPAVMAAGLLTFLAMTIPALAFVGAFSVVSTEVIWTPLFIILFAGYWFWGNLVQPSVAPTLSCTLLSPVGGNVSAGLFGGTALYAGSCARPVTDPTTLDALLSLLLIVGAALLAMLAGQAAAARRRWAR
jgi:hypothetical protein